MRCGDSHRYVPELRLGVLHERGKRQRRDLLQQQCELQAGGLEHGPALLRRCRGSVARGSLRNRGEVRSLNEESPASGCASGNRSRLPAFNERWTA